MSVTSCTRDRDNRRLRITKGSAHTYVQGFIIQTDDATDGQLTVYLQAQVSTPHPLPSPTEVWTDPGGDTDTGALALEYDFEMDRNNRQLWRCTVTFRPPQPGDPITPADVDPDPLVRPVRYWVEYQESQIELETDGAGNRILNAAGTDYPTPILWPESRMVLAARKNYATLSEIIALNDTYQRTTNNAVWFGRAAKTWRYLRTDTTEPRFENNTEFYEGVTRLEFNSDGFTIDKEEQGLVYLDAGTGLWVTPLDDAGLPLGGPVNLAANGDRRDDNLAPLTTTIEPLSAVDYTLIGIGS